MIVSWNWLADYVETGDDIDAACDRLTMSGLNLEGTAPVLEGRDTAIDLEVTSNRSDCLGHLGVARELAVLLRDGRMCQPSAELPGDAAAPNATSPDAAASDSGPGEHAQQLVTVDINCPDACSHYTARVVRGVKVGPSPQWLADRLKAIGLTPVNNIVDVTNYVMFESGHPLHAFDLSAVGGDHIIVRHAQSGETLEAINHKTYELASDDCVIADASRPIALAGVMGGADSEISAETVDVLVEAAVFDPVSVRTTARRHVLFSDASYRFERGVDEHGLDWASRRCCELIVQTAGGSVAPGVSRAGRFRPWDPEPITLRETAVPRLLGIDIATDERRRILTALGCEVEERGGEERGGEERGGDLVVRPPSWRRDLTREVDLIEEVARISGYDAIPDDRPIPVAVQLPDARQQVRERAIETLVAAGLHEAMTLAFVSEGSLEYFRPLPDLPPVRTTHTSRRRENLLRPSLVPDLLQARRENERFGQKNVELFEVARAFHRAEPSDPTAQPVMIAGVCSRSVRELRGLLETLAERCCGPVSTTVVPSEIAQFATGRGAEIILGDTPWGWFGELHGDVAAKLDLETHPTVFEVRLAPLADRLLPLRTATAAPIFPAVTRDLNFVLDEAVTWDALAAVVREAAGRLLERVEFVDEYRGEHIDAGKKSYVLALRYRDELKTLTGEEVDAVQQQVVEAVQQELGGMQR